MLLPVRSGTFCCFPYFFLRRTCSQHALRLIRPTGWRPRAAPHCPCTTACVSAAAEMVVLGLWFLLLLTLCDTDDFYVKTVGRKTEVTPVCNTSNTMAIITLVVCKVSPERSGADPCSLVYQYDGQRYRFEQGCGSSFTLTGNNQTAFVRLQQLPAVDSWNITCSCSHLEGTRIFHLSVTVEDSEEEVEDLSTRTVPYAFISAAAAILLITVILVLVCRKLRRRKQPDPLRNPAATGDEDEGPYSTFIHTGSGLYSVVKLNCPHTNTNNSHMAP